MDYIFNASDYPKPLALLNVVFPDIPMLNINLADYEAVKIVGKEMENKVDFNKGMITGR